MFLITNNLLDLVHAGAYQLEIINAVMHMQDCSYLPEVSINPPETIMVAKFTVKEDIN